MLIIKNENSKTQFEGKYICTNARGVITLFGRLKIGRLYPKCCAFGEC